MTEPKRISDLATPAFVLNRHAFMINCIAVSEAANRGNLNLRPHIKTHKTTEGAFIQAYCSVMPPCKQKVELGPSHIAEVTGFVASTIPEVSLLVGLAERFGGPFQDILYGVPVSSSKLRELHELRTKLESGHIHLMVDHPTQVDFVEQFVSEHCPLFPFSVFLKLDTGYHRAGITCDDRGVGLARRILDSSHLGLRGVYSHCGHSYDVNDPQKLNDIAEADLSQIVKFVQLLNENLQSSGKEEYVDTTLDNLIVSVGSTPSVFSHRNSDDAMLNNLEIHPGNYTLCDRQQLWTGVCPNEAHVAGRVISRVIGHYEDRNTILLDAGATALTKDTTPQGGVCSIAGRSEDLECYKMSQEVILVRTVDRNQPFPFDEFPIGSIVTLLPNHSCLAAACFDRYHIIDDPSSEFSPDEVIIEEWKPAKGW